MSANRQRLPQSLSVLLVAALLAGASACDTPSSAGAGHAVAALALAAQPGVNNGPACEPDAEAVEAAVGVQACTTTDDLCPCGSYCAASLGSTAGACDAECLDSAECGQGQRCDSRGLCVDAPGLSVSPTGLLFEAREVFRTVTVASAGGVEGLEIVAPADVSLDCGSGFGVSQTSPSACSVASLAAGQAHTLSVAVAACAATSCGGACGSCAAGQQCEAGQCRPTWGAMDDPCYQSATGDFEQLCVGDNLVMCEDWFLNDYVACQHGCEATTTSAGVVARCADLRYQLAVTGGGERESVSLELRPALTQSAAITGTWEGTATLVRSGVEGSGSLAGVHPSIGADLPIAVTVDIAPSTTSTHVMSIHDPTRALGGGHQLGGVIDCGASGACTWWYFGYPGTPEAPFSTDVSAATVAHSGAHLEGTLHLPLHSMWLTPSPFVEVELSLSRTGSFNQALVMPDTSVGVVQDNDAPRAFEQSAINAFGRAGCCDAACTPSFTCDGGAEILSQVELDAQAQDWSDSQPSASLLECEVDALLESIHCGSAGQDSCQSLEETYGCEVEAIECGPYNAWLFWINNNTSYGTAWLVDYFPTCVGVCDAPVALPGPVDKPAICAQRYLCAGEDGFSHASEMIELFNPRTGDLQCGARPTADGDMQAAGAPAATPFFDDVPPLVNDAGLVRPITSAEMLGACVEELLHREPAPKGAPREQVFEDVMCLDRARFERALGHAAEAALQAPENGSCLERCGGSSATCYCDAACTSYGDCCGDYEAMCSAPPQLGSQAGEALFLRMLQQWLEVHMFAGREYLQQQVYTELLGSPYIGPQLDEVLDTLQAGWSFVLHPRVTAPLGQVDAEVLAEPDYRTRLVPGAAVGALDPQRIGLPVTLLEAITVHLELVERSFTALWYLYDGQVPEGVFERYAIARRHLHALEGLANGLYQRAITAGPVPWESRWQSARGDLQATLRRVEQLALAIADGRNPLGIEDEDLPLYIPDTTPVGAQEVYFAAETLLRPRVETAVDRAATAYAAAAGRADQLIGRQHQDAQYLTALAQQRLAVDVRYGQALQNLCGVKANVSADTYLALVMDTDRDGEPDLAAERCFLDATSGCTIDPEDLYTQVTSDYARYTACVMGELRVRHGRLVRWESEAVDAIADAVAAGAPVDGAYVVSLGGTRHASFQVPAGAVVPVGDLIAAPRGIERVPYESLQAANTTCQGAFPLARAPRPADLPNNVLDNPTCFQGQLGELTLGLQTASVAVELARTRLGEHLERYRLASRRCTELEAANSWRLEMEGRHQDVMTGLRWAKAAADITVAILDEVSITKMFDSVGFNYGKAAARTASITLASTMEQINANHAHSVLLWSSRLQEAQCAIDADLQMVGIRSAGVEVTRALSEYATTATRLRNARDEVRSLVATAKAERGAIPTEAGAPRLAHERWLDPALEALVAETRRAKRYVYLYARLAEYLKQTPHTGLREDALRKRTVSDLMAHYVYIDKSLGTRLTAGGRSPEEGVRVVSLCGLMTTPAGEVYDEDAECTDDEARALFRSLLTSDEHVAKVHPLTGKIGQWGQLVPFALRPSDNEETMAAERLNLVSVMFDVAAGSAFSTSNPGKVALLQQNRFESQWESAGGVSRPTQLQEGSTRPCKNLLNDEQYAECSAGSLQAAGLTPNPAASGNGTSWEASTVSTVAASFHVGHQLKSRGLYSDYARFLPSGLLDDLNVDNLSDIRLRFDFVGVQQ